MVNVAFGLALFIWQNSRCSYLLMETSIADSLKFVICGTKQLPTGVSWSLSGLIRLMVFTFEKSKPSVVHRQIFTLRLESLKRSPVKGVLL